jgi:hypothetical protein
MDKEESVQFTVIGELTVQLNELVELRNDILSRYNDIKPAEKSVKSYRVVDSDSELGNAAIAEVEKNPSLAKAYIKIGLIASINDGISTEVSDLRNELKTVDTKIAELMKNLTSTAKTGSIGKRSGNGIRAAPTANGKNKKPAGWYKFNDTVKMDMNVRNITTEGKNQMCDYDVDGKTCHSKLVNSVIAWHRIHDPVIKSIPEKVTA